MHSFESVWFGSIGGIGGIWNLLKYIISDVPEFKWILNVLVIETGVLLKKESTCQLAVTKN